MIWFEINQYYNSWSCLWLFASYKRVFSFFLPLLFCVARLVPSLSYEQNDLILLKQETTEDSFFTFGRSRKFCYESLWLKTDTKVKEFQKLKAKDRNASALVETFRFRVDSCVEVLLVLGDRWWQSRIQKRRMDRHSYYTM